MAELRPVVGPVLSGEALLERWRHLPSVDPGRWRQDVDDVVDQGW